MHAKCGDDGGAYFGFFFIAVGDFEGALDFSGLAVKKSSGRELTERKAYNQKTLIQTI